MIIKEIEKLIHKLTELKDLLQLAVYMNNVMVLYIQDKNLIDDFDKWRKEQIPIEKVH